MSAANHERSELWQQEVWNHVTPVGRKRTAAIQGAFAAVLVTVVGLVSTSVRPAHAHVGSVVASAKFCRPPPPEGIPDGDGGVRYSYVPEEADRSYRLAWDDGDNDPTARLTLYYLARQVPTRVVAVEVEAEGHVVRTVDGREARDIHVSCACAGEDGGAAACASDASATCFDGGARWCDNTVEWDTSEVADGVYWIAAVNNDPPFHLYAVSAAPVRVSHGGRKPPVVVVVKPDGADPAADTSYRIDMLVAGEGALTLDLGYGRNTVIGVGDPVTTIARGVPASPAAGGLVGHLWDTSAVAAGMYYVEVTVTDGAGLHTTTRSRQSVSISRRVIADAAGKADAPEGDPASKPSCDCRTGGRGNGRSTPLLLAVLSLVAGVRGRRWLRGRSGAARTPTSK